VDEEMENSLSMVSSNMDALMNSMNSLSWLLEADGTVGKNLHLYFDEENTAKKGDLLIYIQEQIANYEVANPSSGNLTYILFPKNRKKPVKINSSSLASGELPEDKYYLCKWNNITFFGPHPSKSKVASYPCISLLRSYKLKQKYGDIYIYLESGYKYFQKLIPADVMGMDTVFLIESENGVTMYSSDESLVPLYSKTNDYLNNLTVSTRRYKAYESTEKGGWKIHLWVPVKKYYRQIYGMALNFGFVTMLVVIVCIFVSIIQWRSIYRPFIRFEKKLQKIASDNDVETKVEQMNIQEFDDSFALLEKMKNNILLLLSRVQIEEKRRSELEIKELLGKINPHFLYNTLDTLKWYAAGKSDKEMVHFITSLNKLLLYNISKTTETTLKSELDAINDYIVLQKLKYDIDFHVNTGTHPEILQADMPRFVLQPLVENAILHSGSIQGKIWIDVELLANGKIAILVKNDGTPIDPGKIKEVLVQKNDISSNGIGLQYVARMFENRFGDDFELKAERMKDGINVVEIRIPFEAEKIVKKI
jgi:sensor histidine kinase YesM